jgi:aminomethyltransferase
VLTNDVNKLAVGQAQYTLLCNERGGVVDDLYVYRLEDQKYLLIVNASRTEADWDWLQVQYDRSPVSSGLQLKNASSELAAVAIQGPRVASFMDRALPGGSLGGRVVDRVTQLSKNEVGIFVFHGVTVFVARTGYTGEDGFEVVAPADDMERIWTSVLHHGQAEGLQPTGLGARDTLRTEMCYPLYGQELNETITPLEAALGFFVALDKGDFIGRQALLDQKAAGPAKRCVAFTLPEKSPPPRPHYPIWSPSQQTGPVGEVSSGTQSPSLGIGIGMGFVPAALAKPGQPIEIEVRGRRIPAEVVRKPIYRKSLPS